MEKITMDGRVYQALGDELSEIIYRNRIDFSNGSQKAIESMIRMVMKRDDFFDFMQKYKDNIYIFGAGMLGRNLLSTWGINGKYGFKGFIDNDEKKHGTRIGNLPVIALNELEGDKGHAAIIIMNKLSYDKIAKQVEMAGFAKEQIYNFGEVYQTYIKNQYFDLENLKIKAGEKFVDCGALNGETSLNLIERYGNRIYKVWMFEPDKKNVEKCKRNFSEIKETEYEIIEKGVWSCSTRLRFDSLGNGCASINEQGRDFIDTVKLDDILENDAPSFIKMDIEGAELEALKGAEQIIKRVHPKLAVSIYHRPEDIDEIPRLLLEYYPEYKFYLRHYSLMKTETVLYAL